MGTSRRRFDLTSTKHLVGMGLAAIGPVLALVGVVQPLVGLALAAPLYAAGVLAAPSSKRPDVVIGGLDASHVLGELTDVERSVHGTVDRSVEERVLRITKTIRDTLPRLDALGPGSAQAHTLVQTATDYLPDALGAYLKLPRSYAENQKLGDGRTPLQVLSAQLDLLGSRMDEVLAAVVRADTDALMAHGRFLQDKFARGSLDLGSGNGRS